MRFTNKVAVVTGAASGIGRETTRRLVEEGAVVVAIDIEADGLAALVTEHSPDTVRACHLDVSDRPAVDAAVQAAVGELGRLDVVINLAATVDNWGLPADIAETTWQRVLAVNLRGVTHVCAAALRMTPELVIVNTSSIVGGLKPSATRAPYSAAKAAVIAYTRDLALAYGSRGVRANTIVPGFIDTPMSQRLVLGFEAQAEAEANRIPLRRLGRAAEVAESILFLASEDASYVNGAVLVIDGGLSLV